MDTVIRRDFYLKQLIDKKESGLIKMITGIKRCGKSYLLFNLFYDYLFASGVKEERIITVALDDYIFVQYRDPDLLSQYLRSKIVKERLIRFQKTVTVLTADWELLIKDGPWKP